MCLTLLPFALLAPLSAADDARITIHADQPTVAVGRSLYGIFFEEINQAGDGGLYAELLRSRGMENGEGTKLPVGWRAIGAPDGEVTLDSVGPLNEARRHSLRIERLKADRPFGVANEGFWGIPLTKGERYRLTLWIRGDSPLDVALQSSSGRELATGHAPASANWKRFEETLRPSADDAKATLTLVPSKPGKVWVAYASLMPVKTWKDRSNGLRVDLAEHVNAMRPGFVRFPGGCYVEGGDRFEDAFDWRRSVEPVEARQGLAHSMWGYSNTFGLGYHEYLQWCEDLGADPLFVVNCGLNHKQMTPMPEMAQWVDNALDAIEYANGPVTTKWGAVRARNGHPNPFGLKYVEIGNEQGGWFFGGNEAYEPRYRVIYDAIKSKHPEITTIADWRINEPMEMVDEHYYETPSWFWRNATKYDGYDRKGPKIYVGEYAVTRGSGEGNLDAALGEAAFMTGMERNADVVRMSSYAPLFVNVNNRQWNPNAIVFDNNRSYGTPSYWVQALFAQNRVDRILAHSLVVPAVSAGAISGRAGLQTWKTAAEFRDVSLEVDGKVILAKPDLKLEDLDGRHGEWTSEDGAARQTSLDQDRRALFHGSDFREVGSVSLRLKARKLNGAEGFIVMLAVAPGKELQWNLGGWGNKIHAFQHDGERMGLGIEGRIETGRWYDIRIDYQAGHIKGYLDGKLIQEANDVPTPEFVAVAGIDERANEIVIKAVNRANEPRTAAIEITGAKIGRTGKAIVLTGDRLDEENSFDAAMRIAPKTARFSVNGSHTFPPRSVTILRIPRD